MENFRVEYSGKKYDLADFLKHHPGGVNYVKNYEEKDVTIRMKDIQHSASAYYLLREYQIGGRDEKENLNCEDLEHLVDWNEPMLSQVANLGTKYSEWVISPVDRQLRLFRNPIFENLTITPWWLVPVIWIPIILYYIHQGYYEYIQHNQNSNKLFLVIFYILFGIVLWTLIEYSLHRWVFHMNPSGASKTMIYIHFAIHGLHHKVPFDTRRLVFPPLPCAIVVFIMYQVFKRILPYHTLHLIFGGGILGYVIYDMIHFYLHYGTPEEGTYLYKMKRYHNHHHFSHHNSGYGISNPAWDKLFGTFIKLKRLGMGIRWR